MKYTIELPASHWRLLEVVAHNERRTVQQVLDDWLHAMLVAELEKLTIDMKTACDCYLQKLDQDLSVFRERDDRVPQHRTRAIRELTRGMREVCAPILRAAENLPEPPAS